MTIRRAIPANRDALLDMWLRSRGFVVEGRSELDGTGRPLSLLHVRLAAPSQPR